MFCMLKDGNKTSKKQKPRAAFVPCHLKVIRNESILWKVGIFMKDNNLTRRAVELAGVHRSWARGKPEIVK